jgi:hypothetical protein
MTRFDLVFRFSYHLSFYIANLQQQGLSKDNLRCENIPKSIVSGVNLTRLTFYVKEQS